MWLGGLELLRVCSEKGFDLGDTFIQSGVLLNKILNRLGNFLKGVRYAKGESAVNFIIDFQFQLFVKCACNFCCYVVSINSCLL